MKALRRLRQHSFNPPTFHKSPHLINARNINTTSTQSANTLPNTISAPPPPPPTPPKPSISNEAAARLAHRKSQLERAAANRRFWKHVHVVSTPTSGDLQIHLDTRPVRTPTKEIVTVPTSKPHLATAIALEWDALPSSMAALRPHAIPLTSLVGRAMDLQREESGEIRRGVLDMLLRYFQTDTVLCWAPEKGDEGREASLRELQKRSALPILEYLETRVWPGVKIDPVLSEGSLFPKEHPADAVEVVRKWLLELDGWELAALERATLATKSFLVAVRTVVEWSEKLDHLRPATKAEKRFGIEDAVEASTVEVRWQTEQWGEVDDTHDVDKEDLRRQIGGVILLVNGTGNRK